LSEKLVEAGAIVADSKTIVIKFEAIIAGVSSTFYYSTKPVHDDGGLVIRSRMTDEPEFNKSVGLWLWGTRSESGVADVELANADGALDQLVEADVRDQTAEILSGVDGEDFSTYTKIATLIIDRIITTANDQIRVVFLSPQTALAQTLQKGFWTASVPNDSLVGRPIPYAWGLIYQAPSDAFDPLNLKFATVHLRGGPAEILDVSSNGAPALVSQYSVSEYGFTMTITPAGKVTSSFYANQKQTGITTSDLPSGYPNSGEINNGQNEDFTAYTGTKPSGYTLSNDAVVGPPETDIRRNGLNSSLRVVNEGTGFSSFISNAPTLARDIGMIKGRRYGARLEFVTIGGLSNSLRSFVCATLNPADMGKNASGLLYPDEYTNAAQIVFPTVAGTGDDLVWFFEAGGSAIELYFGGDFFGAGIDTGIGVQSLRIWDVITGEALTVDDAVPFLTSNLENAPTLNSSDLTALSNSIGDHTLGNFYSRQVTADRAILDALNPFLAWYYFDQSGEMRFGRLFDPDPPAPVAPEWVTADQKSQNSNNTSGPFVIDRPDNCEEGDLLVFIKSASTESGALSDGGLAPVGFVLQEQNPDPAGSSGDPCIEVWTKAIEDLENEPESYVYDPRGSEQRHQALIGRVINWNRVGDSNSNYFTSTSNPAAPSVTVEKAPALLICAATDRGRDFATSAPSGMDELVFGERFTTFDNLSVAVEEISSAGATGSRTFNLGTGEKATLSIVIESTGGSPITPPAVSFTITENNIPQGFEPRIRPDLMPGLSDTFGGRKNHQPITEAAADAATASDIKEKSDAAAPFRFVSRGFDSDLDPFYSWAHDRCIVETTIQDQAALDNARDYVAKHIANRRRFFCEVSVLIDPNDIIDPGDVVEVTYPRFGLDAGVKFIVIGVRRRYNGRRADLILWR